jgi:hypothetical protein
MYASVLKLFLQSWQVDLSTMDAPPSPITIVFGVTKHSPENGAAWGRFKAEFTRTSKNASVF